MSGVRFRWLWGPLYRGLEVSRGQRLLLWLGWRTRLGRQLKGNGW